MSTAPIEIPAGLDKLVETLASERPILKTQKAPKFRLLARLPPRRPVVNAQRHTRSNSTSGESTEGSENKTRELSPPKRKNPGEVEIIHETVTVHRRVVRWTLSVVDDEEPNKRQKIEQVESEEESESEDDSEDESDSMETR
ncbi:hypothetical protein FRC10_004089 [Ceratobasidium sp. 414]|nr:hypothetical protein FRC10_004089 [Ceratobasidium sp. 414]